MQKLKRAVADINHDPKKEKDRGFLVHPRSLSNLQCINQMARPHRRTTARDATTTN